MLKFVQKAMDDHTVYNGVKILSVKLLKINCRVKVLMSKIKCECQTADLYVNKQYK